MSHPKLEPKKENYDDVPEVVSIRWLFERRIAELEDQRVTFEKMMASVINDDDSKAQFGMLALAANAAIDEIRDYLMKLFAGFIDLDLPLAAEMNVYYADDKSEDVRPGTWGPIEVVHGDVVVHLKAGEVADATDVEVGGAEGEEAQSPHH